MLLDEVLTFSEAAEKWGLADGKTIRKAVERKRFRDDEIKKSGNVWLTTYEAMSRVFGEPRHKGITLYYRDVIADEHIASLLKDFFDEAVNVIQDGGIVSVAESRKHPERILYILKTIEEIEKERHKLQYFMIRKDKE